MKVCGIYLSGSEAIVVILEGTFDDYSIIYTDVKKIELEDSKDQENVKSFYTTIKNFFKEYALDKIVIRDRQMKGKYSGGADTFKMEGLIQILDYEIEIVHHSTINSVIDKDLIDYSCVNKYQYRALEAAFYMLKKNES